VIPDGSIATVQSLANTTLGKFDVIREVDRGSMGTVYLGHVPFADHDSSIKVAHPEQMRDAQLGSCYRKMFFNEAKVAGRLRHHNIVKVFDAGVDNDVCFIIMEYVAGGETLHKHCCGANLLPMEDVVRIAFRCAQALAYAHRKSVIHRDIKIGDFSIALIFEPDATETQVHGYVGSPLYMSPEQVHEESLTSQSDLFSLGVVMYEMIAGEHPFHGESLPGIIQKITEIPHTPIAQVRSDVPAVLGHIVDRCLKEKSSERYKIGLDLAADLSQVFPHIKLLDEEVPDREKFTLVKDLRLFVDFSEPETWDVINASAWHVYDPGAEVITEGEIDNTFYIVVTGEAEIRKGDQTVGPLHPWRLLWRDGIHLRRQSAHSEHRRHDLNHRHESARITAMSA
jgi:serine/threonine protein kinase